MDAPTQRDLFLIGREEAILSPSRFDRSIIDVDGSDVNVVLQAAAAMGEEVSRFLAVALLELALSTATGEALDRWVFDRYQLTRQEATNAVVTLRLTRTGTAGFTVPTGSQFGSDDGVVFTSANDVAFAAGNIGPLDVLATADRTGPEGDVAAGTITTVISGLEDDTVSVTNVEAAAGGREREDDDQLRDRARDFFITARRGTKEAIEFGALQVGRVSQATAVEVLTAGLGSYRVTLNIADANGQANSALSTLVGRSLDEYRALGVPVSVVPAVPQYVDVTASGLLFDAGVNTTDVLDLAAAAVVGFIETLAPGSILRRSDILRVLSSIDGLIVPDGALTAPSGDLVPSTGTAIRTTRDRVQLTG